MKKAAIGFFSVGISGAFDAKVAAANYRAAAGEMRALGKKHDFKPVICEKILYNRAELSAFLSRCGAEEVGMIVLHTASFTAGEMGQQSAFFALERRMPFLIWGVPEPEGGPLTANNLCCANFMTSVFHSMGAKYKWVWGAPGDAAVEREIAAGAATVRAISALKNSPVIVIGSSRVPGFYGSNFDETAIKRRYGVSVERIPLSEFYKAFEGVTAAQEKTAAGKIMKTGARCVAGKEDIARSARAYTALRKIARDAGAAGLAVRCWPEMRDDIGVDACLPMGMLGDDGLPCSCEADVPGLLTMMIQLELTGGKEGPPALLDMVSVNEKPGSVGLWHCGPASPSLAKGGMKICRHNIVEQGNPDAKMGLVLEMSMKPGAATLCRFQGDSADTYLAAAGEVLNTPPAFRGSYAEFRPDTMTARDLLNTIMTRGVTHHYSLAYSDHLALIDETAYWLDVKRIEAAPAGARGANFGKV